MCRRRARERGQTVILALAFIAFFGVVVVSVLRFADTTGMQHVRTEATASSDSSAEGGAAYAAANAARTDLVPTCSDTATLAMQSGDTVGYTVRDCNPGNTTTIGSGAAGYCLLCILNETPLPPSTTTSPTTNVLTLLTAQCPVGSFCGVKTIGGDDFVNGGITGSLTACASATSCPGSAHIRVLSPPSNYAGCVCNPNATAYPRTLPDPLASLPAPTPVGEPANCTSAAVGGTWDGASGCSVTLSKGPTVTLAPGVWNTVKVSGQASVQLTSGVYVLTGGLSVSGQAILCAPGTIDASGNCTPTPGVTLYLACRGSVASGKAYLPCSASGATGGSMSFPGQGAVSVTAPRCPDGDIVPCPSLPYGLVAVLSDPHLLDTGGVASCITGSGCTLTVSGNGKSINGSVDMRSSGISIGGNGGDSVSDGFLIANSFYSNVTGKVSSGLSLTGPGSLSTVNLCFVYDDYVYPGLTAPPSPARAVIQAQCGAQLTSGVVDFNYGP